MTLFTLLDRWRCGLKGHVTHLRWDKKTIYIACTECGWASPGWTIDGAKPKPRRSNVVPMRRSA